MSGRGESADGLKRLLLCQEALAHCGNLILSYLGENSLTMLPATVFSGLTALQILYVVYVCRVPRREMRGRVRRDREPGRNETCGCGMREQETCGCGMRCEAFARSSATTC